MSTFHVLCGLHDREGLGFSRTLERLLSKLAAVTRWSGRLSYFLFRRFFVAFFLVAPFFLRLAMGVTSFLIEKV